MRRRGIRRFLVEVVFLAGVAAALTVADLRPAGVIALMAVALLVVWLAEWISWLDEPHYGRGLPPRYYVPHVALPPPRPIEQWRPAASSGGGYPVLELDDAPTFVASTQEWAAALDEWPIGSDAEDTALAVPEAAATVVPLPPPMVELEATMAADFGAVEELDTETHEDDDFDEPEPAEPKRSSPPTMRPEPHELPPLEPAPRRQMTVLHHVDPLASGRRRRFRRRRESEEQVVEVLDGPPPDRPLPLRVRDAGRARAR